MRLEPLSQLPTHFFMRLNKFLGHLHNNNSIELLLGTLPPWVRDLLRREAIKQTPLFSELF